MKMEEWKECKLSDICDYGKDRIEVSSLDNSNYISTENMLPNRAGITTATTLPTGELTPSFEIDDTLVSNIRPYFKKLWKATFSGGCSADVLVFKAKENISKEYLYYVLADDEFFKYSMTTSKGTKMPRGDKTSIMNYPVKLPPLPTQQKIAAILSSLDDKIELNNKINTNLEQQAHALFKNWFVDFEPFDGKMPEGWKEVSLNDVCLKITDGSHYSPKDDKQAEIPMLSVKDMEKYGFNTKDCKHINEEEFNKMLKNDCVPQVNDILVAKDGSYLKEIFICNKFEQLAILSSIAIFRPNTKIIYPEILLTLLKSPRVMKEVRDNYVSGSALPRIVLKDFKKLKFFIPNISEQSKLAKLLSEIRFQIDNNVKENQNLSELRDTLLPKLMNGEFVI